MIQFFVRTAERQIVCQRLRQLSPSLLIATGYRFVLTCLEEAVWYCRVTRAEVIAVLFLAIRFRDACVAAGYPLTFRYFCATES